VDGAKGGIIGYIMETAAQTSLDIIEKCNSSHCINGSGACHVSDAIQGDACHSVRSMHPATAVHDGTKPFCSHSSSQKHIMIVRNDTQMLGKADTRIYPWDTIKKQSRNLSLTGYPGLNFIKPSVPLPVIYEDDHMAIGKSVCTCTPCGCDFVHLIFVTVNSQQAIRHDLSLAHQRWLQRQLGPKVRRSASDAIIFSLCTE